MRGITRGVGSRPTPQAENKPILKALYTAGYTRDILAKELEISKPTFYDYFSKPRHFKIWQMQHMSYLLNKPLHEVINLALGYKEGCPQWVNSSVDADILKQVFDPGASPVNKSKDQ